VELAGVSKVNPMGAGVRALSGVSLSIAPNDYLAIVGPSGSGKSTLLHLVGLLDRPTAGTLRFEGVDTAGLSDRELSRLRGRAIGFVFQSFHLLPHLSVIENVGLPLFYQGVPWRQRRTRAAAQLAAVNLAHRGRHRPAQLSGGERQRAAIARALVTEPRLLLADEPTGNLDSHSGAEILALFERLHASGRTVAVITHDPAIAARMPRLVRLADGEIREDRRR
jgi:putative ABC transport system ATP-binding protein